MIVVIRLVGVQNTRDLFDGTIGMPRSKKRRRRVADNLRQVEKVRRKLNKNEENKEDKENELLCEQKLLVCDDPAVQTQDETVECKRPGVKQSQQHESEEEEAREKSEGSWFPIDWGGIYNGLVQVSLK